MPNRILIVDDHEIIRHRVRSLFRQDRDALCEEASSGSEALQKAKDFHPDLVVLDFSMPGMSGVEAAGKLKEEYPRMHIVMLTAFKDKHLLTKAYQAGVTWVLSKTEDDVTRVRDFARILLRPEPPRATAV